MPILGDFAVKYGQQAPKLGVPTDDLYQALVDTAENTVRSYRIHRQIADLPEVPCIASHLTGTWVSKSSGSLDAS